MKNQIQTAIELRDRATQVALNFVGHRISSSDGSYSLLIDCIAAELAEAFKDGWNTSATKDLSETQLQHMCQCSVCDPPFSTLT